MTVGELAEKLSFKILAGGEALSRKVERVYTCDLLSYVIGRAPAESAWVTVMGNVNAVAVALLADVSCVVIAENGTLDGEAKIKADQNDIAVLVSSGPVFETALLIYEAIGR